MVAELTGIPITVSAKDKSSSKLSVVSLSSDTEVDSESHNKDKKKRPRWIRTATRDPIYTVLDDRDCSYTNKSNKCLEIAISAVKSQAIKEPEEPLYSVVKKPPKLIDAEVSQEKSRQEILSKQRELHKWLESSSAAKEQEMDEKPDDPWAAPGISVPRGVIGIVGPYGRAYTNPNEKREYMLEEELEEIEECPEDISTAVDSIDGRYRDKNNKSEYDDDKDSHIVKKEINRRPKWRVISEVDEQEIIKEITMDKETSLDNRDSDYIDDIYGDKPPKYFSKDNYDNGKNYIGINNKIIYVNIKCLYFNSICKSYYGTRHWSCVR